MSFALYVSLSTRWHRSNAIGPREKLIAYVGRQPGHDQRYAIDASKIERELGWRPAETFETASERPLPGISTIRLGGTCTLRRLSRRAARCCRLTSVVIRPTN